MLGGRLGLRAGHTDRLGRVGCGLGGVGRDLVTLPRPCLIELHPPLALLALLQRKLGTEGTAAAPLEAGDGLRRPPRRDELLGDRERQRLARLRLPDDEATAGILARPAREALAVL